MAKKRRKQKEEEESYEFKMPEFDEEEYLRKEVRDSKTLFVTFVYGVLIAFVSFGLNFVDVALAALVGFIAIIFIRHLYPLIGVDSSLLEKKQWATNIIFYIFTWLLVWIILSNPPFSDFQEPTIKSNGIYFGSPGNWTRLNDTNGGDLDYQVNVSVNITVRDNVDVDESSVRIIIMHGESEIANAKMESKGNDRYVFVINNLAQSDHHFTIYAKDVNDHESSFKGTFKVN
jgi:hypothetical protein